MSINSTAQIQWKCEHKQVFDLRTCQQHSRATYTGLRAMTDLSLVLRS